MFEVARMPRSVVMSRGWRLAAAVWQMCGVTHGVSPMSRGVVWRSAAERADAQCHDCSRHHRRSRGCASVVRISSGSLAASTRPPWKSQRPPLCIYTSNQYKISTGNIQF